MWLANYTLALAQGLKGASMSNPGDITYRQACEMLEAYYLNNDLYRTVAQALRDEGVWTEAIRELRNPTYRAVEFYTMTVWPGPLPDALPIVSDNAKLEAVVHKLWKWSNWGSKKQFAVRQFALTGDLFIRVATSGDPATRVYLQVIRSRDVTDFEEDERGNITWLRYDAAKSRVVRGEREAYTHTEEWTPEVQRIWEHDRGVDVELEQLGMPDSEIPMQAFGIDFVPWVRAPFQDIGDVNGLPLVWPCLSKIDEVNRKCTRLAQLMYRNNRALWALAANALDSEGRPLPAPRISQRGTSRDDSETFELGDNDIIKLPGMSTLTPLVPDLDYPAFLDSIEKDLIEIKSDLPEIRYYDLMESGNASGRALSYMMAPAISRVTEVRGNAETALVRAQKMALTIGQELRLDGFAGLGSYDADDLEHSFSPRDVLPILDIDRAETAKAYTDMGVSLGSALERYAGWSEEDAAAEEAKAPAASAAPTVGAPAGTPQAGVKRTPDDVAPKIAAAVKPVDMVGGLPPGALTRAVNRVRGTQAQNGN